MQTQRTVDGTPSPDSAFVGLPVGLPVLPRRSARRATARRASDRRATARERHDDIEGRIVDYLKDHPASTTGDIAKGLNAKRATIAAARWHMARGSAVTNGQAAE